MLRILVQLALYCALFTGMVKLGVGNSALNGLFFYPKPVQERVYALGLTDRETVAGKRKRFMKACGARSAVWRRNWRKRNAPGRSLKKNADI